MKNCLLIACVFTLLAFHIPPLQAAQRLLAQEDSAVIELDPEELNPVTLAGNDADPDTFTITNIGVDALSYTVETDEPWLSASPTTGTLSADESDTIDVTYSTAELDVGEYSASITVSDPAAANSPRTVVVNLTVYGPEPIIAFDPEAIDIQTDFNVNPGPESFNISNDGLQFGTVMTYELSTDAPWLDVAPSAGALTADGITFDAIIMTFDTDAMEPGTYSANVIAESDQAQNSPATLPVSLAINETRALIALDPELIERTIDEGETATSATVTLMNSGFDALDYTVDLAGDSPEGWISVSPTSGTLAPGEEDFLDVVFDTAALSGGSYTAELVVSDPDAGNSPQSVDVALEVISHGAPIIALGRESINVDAARESGVPPVPLAIGNEGDAALNYTASISFAETVDPWLFIAPREGTVPAGDSTEAELTFDITGLEAGDYGAVVSVSDPNAENDPQTTVVSLRVIPTSHEFTFSEGTDGWVFENEAPPFEEALGNHNEELGRLEITTSDNENTFAYWRTDPDDPIRIAAAGDSEAHESQVVLGGTHGDDSLFRTTWTVYSDTPSSETPTVRLRISSLDWSSTHKLGFTSLANHSLSADSDGIDYVQYFTQPGHSNHFNLFFDVVNIAGFGRPDATVSLDRVLVESLGTADLGEGTTLLSYNFNELTNGFTFRDAEPFIDAASSAGPEPGAPNPLGLEIFGGDYEEGEAPPVLFGYWGHETGVPTPGNSLVRLTFRVGSNVPEEEEFALPTIRLRFNDGSLMFSALHIVHPAEGATLPSEGHSPQYDLWLLAPPEIGEEEMVLSFDYLATPGEGPVDPSWSIGLLDLDITVFDLP